MSVVNGSPEAKIAERGIAAAAILILAGIALAVTSIWFVPWPLWGKTLASGVVLFAAGMITGTATQT